MITLFLFRPRISEKNSFENFAWANLKNFCITESKKCIIAHYSRMEQNFKILNPQVNAEFYETFNGDNEN